MPVMARLTAMPVNHTIAIHAPRRVATVRIARPTAISMTPTSCMNVAGSIGRTAAAAGLRYIDQSARTLKNLSAPATSGPNPNANRKTHHADSIAGFICCSPSPQ